MHKPVLIENGTKYFLRETLKHCHKKNVVYINKVYNWALFLFFIFILGTVLFYKFRTKLTPKEKEKKTKLNKILILNKLKMMRLDRQKERNQMITGLPRFENTFEMLHNQYYKI